MNVLYAKLTNILEANNLDYWFFRSKNCILRMMPGKFADV